MVSRKTNKRGRCTCGLTYMGKFHVRNVTESRDFQYLRVVVRKDVAPCGGLRPKSFIKNLVSPQLLLRFAIFVYQKNIANCHQKLFL